MKATIRTRPDFVFARARLAVFVDGCLVRFRCAARPVLSSLRDSEGHGCPTHATWPKHNAAFWRTKILGNQQRDRAVTRKLKRTGWRVLRLWDEARKCGDGRAQRGPVANAEG